MRTIRSYVKRKGRITDGQNLAIKNLWSNYGVDFKKEMIGESFVINNPKATASCGCGLSFSV